MVVDKLLEICLAQLQARSNTIVAISGAADLGKTYLSLALLQSLRKKGIKAEYLSLDAFLMPRAERTRLGLSGYNIESYELERGLQCLASFKQRQAFQYYPYDHGLGACANDATGVACADILIFDGLHVLHRLFQPYIDTSFFIYTDEANLKEIRFKADLDKRKLSTAQALSHSQSELLNYKQQLQPYQAQADYQLYLKQQWQYRLS